MRDRKKGNTRSDEINRQANILIDLPVADEQADETKGGALGGRAEEFDIIVGSGPGAPGGHVK